MKRCSLAHPLTVIQMAKSTAQIIVWEINSSIEFTTAHRTNFWLDTPNETLDLKATFDLDGSLFVADSVGVSHVRDLHLIAFYFINFLGVFTCTLDYELNIFLFIFSSIREIMRT